jgi:hypothetical protein
MTKCKILFLAANPDCTDRLALDEERRSIGLKIRESDHRDSLELISEWAVRPDDLLQYLNQYAPDVIHFSGHGTEANEIVLKDDKGGAKPVSSAALRQLFTTLKGKIKLVMLNACYSRSQAEAIVDVIDCAVGMKQEIGDDAAIAFAASFYRAIGFGVSVQDAFEQGRTALMLEGIPEENTPTLLVRKGADPKSMFLIADEKNKKKRPKPVAATKPDDAPKDAATQASQQLSLTEILPGAWQVQIQLPFAAAQMGLEMFPNGGFRGQVNGPMGASAVEGQWQANPFAKQVALQGRQFTQFQAGPYMVMIQVTYFDRDQLVGVTSGGEQVSWRRIAAPQS